MGGDQPPGEEGKRIPQGCEKNGLSMCTEQVSCFEGVLDANIYRRDKEPYL
jgi:hypothetical protein